MNERDPVLAQILGVPVAKLGAYLTEQDRAVDTLNRAHAAASDAYRTVGEARDLLSRGMGWAMLTFDLEQADLALAAAEHDLATLLGVIDEFDIVIRRHARKAAA